MNMLFPLLASFIVTVIATPITIIFIKKLKIMDNPKLHKHPAVIHKKPIPRGGGIPLFIGIFIASIMFLPFTKIVIALFIASLLSLIVGVIDDKFDISPYLRFLINIISALIVVGSGLSIPFITNPFGGILYLDTLRISFDFFGHHSILVFSDLIALIWIVWVMNMLNWSKGVDGQMPGVVAISAIIIGIVSLKFQPFDQSTLISSRLSFIIAGAALGFLIFNFHPAKIFPGYGATAVYLLLSAVSILSSAKVATAILVMGVPMIDGAFTIFRRFLTGRSPFWHDKKHLHHLLLSIGFKQRSIALFYWIFSAILGALALVLSSKGKLFVIIMVILVVGGVIFSLHLALNGNDKKNN